MLGNALSLRQAGWEVIFGSGQMPLKGQQDPFEFHGFSVSSLSERKHEDLPSILKHLLYLNMGAKTLVWLKTLDPKPDAVILYSGYSAYFSKLYPWCRSQNIHLAFDAVEWYEPSSMPGGALGPYRWSFELAMRFYCIKAGRVIAISRFLEDWYSQRGVKTARVPPTHDVQANPWRKEQEGFDGSRPLVFAYAGSPGRKDLLDPFIEAVFREKLDQGQLVLKLVGPTTKEILALPSFRQRSLIGLPSWVKITGRLSQPEALDVVRQADYSILLRPVKRYSAAGFSTKSTESLAVGTPLLANITSDMGHFLEDGMNSWAVRGIEAEDVAAVLRAVMAQPACEKTAMRAAARRTAEALFDYRHYADTLDRLLS
jgi:glycosyltransferase involved in cell wall biosynthesis